MRIDEAAGAVGEPQHVLRYWEAQFSAIRPMRRGNQRFYREGDVATLRGVRDLLREHRYTIEGARSVIRLKGEAWLRWLGRNGQEPRALIDETIGKAPAETSGAEVG